MSAGILKARQSEATVNVSELCAALIASFSNRIRPLCKLYEPNKNKQRFAMFIFSTEERILHHRNVELNYKLKCSMIKQVS